MAHPHPMHCILPPHMVEEIEKNGTQRQREIARENLAVSQAIRGDRAAIVRAEVARAAAAGKDRSVHTANDGTQLPGQKLRGEGDPPSGDAAVDEAYDGSGDTYDMYQQVYDRDSLDGNGMRLVSTVHYRQGYDNAFWNGQQMAYGDGDEDLPEGERLFNRFTKSLDVIGHELTHGVIQFSADLVYQNQSGALNESFADVFGSLVRQWRSDQTADQADWLIGGDLLTANVTGHGIRSLRAPGSAYNDPVLGRDPQPGHMDDFVNTTADSGGVHINSGIPNHAFYVTARELGGQAWTRAGRIWYLTLTNGQLSSQADFQAAATLTHAVAGTEFGTGSAEQRAVATGWKEVGIDVGDAPPAPEPPTGGGRGCLIAAVTLGLFR